MISLITARGGSRAIPKKNIAPLAGKPLIAWTIETALRSRAISRVIVSTDDMEIAEVAQAWGAEVPFIRPAELSRGDSPHIPVLVHAVKWLESHEDVRYDYVLLLQPTSPLRSTEDIDNAVRLALEKDADSVVSVCRAFSHPYFTRRISDDGKLQDFSPKPKGYLRRQDLPPAYVVNGATYLVRRDILMEKQTFYTERTYAYVMPQKRSLDIDTYWDLHVADLILRDKYGMRDD